MIIIYRILFLGWMYVDVCGHSYAEKTVCEEVFYSERKAKLFMLEAKTHNSFVSINIDTVYVSSLLNINPKIK